MKIIHTSTKNNKLKAAGAIVAALLALGCVLAYIDRTGEGNRAVADPASKTEVIKKEEGAEKIESESHRQPASNATLVLTKSQEIDQLVHEGTPASNLAAYKIILACLVARNMEKNGEPSQSREKCGDIASAQFVSRMQYLEIAANAGAPEAYKYFIAEGPQGNGFIEGTKEQLKDPLAAGFFQKAEKYQELAAKAGDLGAIQSMFNLELMNGNTVAAISYLVAQDEISRSRGEQGVQGYEITINSLSKSLSPDLLEGALSSGHQLALAAKNSPYWNSK